MSKRKRHKRAPKPGLDTTYFRSLNAIIDRLFEEAYHRRLKWCDMAELSGLSAETVRRLGERETQYPQYRTVQMLAVALGGRLDFVAGAEAKKIRIHWKPQVFSSRFKLKKAA